jgi:DNA-binding winged helix-turn-helix (wHTH) protein/tetratricopeptide (TPR) repeat protein
MPRPLLDYDVAHFGDCELRIATQELFCRGELCEVEPRVLAVLIYLIENSDRVIPKDELLEKIWKTIHLTDGVVARAVMKLRRAIGDNDFPSKYLKTVHRVGYRFVGELTIESRAPAGAGGATLVARPLLLPDPVDLGLLPFRNDVGGTQFDWVELGLMSIAHRNIATAGVRVAPIADVLMASKEVAAPGLEERAASLRAALGLRLVLAVEVREERGRFVLRWRLWPGGLAHRQGELESHDLVGATVTLAHRVADVVLDQSGGPATASFDLGDPFLNAAYGRAMQAYHSGRFRDAIDLLRVCMPEAPHCLQLEIDLFMMLADSFNGAAFGHGEALLERAAAAGNTGLCAMVLERLAHVCQFFEQLEKAEAYCARCALLLCERQMPEIESRLLATRSVIAWRRRDHESARTLAGAVLKGAQHSGNVLLEAQTLRQLGLIAAGTGRADEAVPLFERVIDLSAQHGFLAVQCMALASLSEAHAVLGRLGLATQLLERAIPLSERAGTAQVNLRVATLRFLLALLQGEASRARAALEQLEHSVQPGPTRFTVILMSCRGLMALLLGDPQEASRLLDEAYRLMPNTRLGLNLLAMTIAPHLKLGEFDTCASRLQMLEERVGGGADRLFSALAHGCRGQLAHAAGDARMAREEIARSLAAAPVATAALLPGAPPFALDAIWLAAEEDDADAVRPIVAALGPWLSESSRGVATQARYCYALGRFSEALELQRRYQSMIGSETHDFCTDLLEDYESAARRGRGAALSRVRTLPSLP